MDVETESTSTSPAQRACIVRPERSLEQHKVDGQGQHLIRSTAHIRVLRAHRRNGGVVKLHNDDKDGDVEFFTTQQRKQQRFIAKLLCFIAIFARKKGRHVDALGTVCWKEVPPAQGGNPGQLGTFG